MIRKAVVAGQFYENNPLRLKKEIGSYLSQTPDEISTDTNEKGLIVPHAGYMFSGQCAAFAYNKIDNNKYDLFIVLGFSHMGLDNRSSTCLCNWSTPLGTAKVDMEFGRLLIDKGLLEENNRSHFHEHSIEVQLPFLQYLFGEEMRFLPISVSPYDNFEKLGEGIRNAIIEAGKKVCVIASSDFTHYGPSYSYTPFKTSKNKREKIMRLDYGSISYIKNLDSIGFLKYCHETGATICGKHAIALLIEIVKKLDVHKVNMLRYYMSGDIVGDYSNTVSYSALSFE